MKLLTICLLLVTLARTMAQGEGETAVTTDAPATEPSTEGPATVPSTSETSADITTGGDTTTATNAPTTGGSTEATVPTTNPTPAPNATNVNLLQCYSCADDDCSEKVVINCPQNSTAPVSLSFLLRNYREISRADAANLKGYACYSIKVTVNATQRDKLGCIGIPEGESACQAVRKELQLTTDDNSDECRACQEDVCNGCTMARLSAVAISCLMLVKVFI